MLIVQQQFVEFVWIGAIIGLARILDVAPIIRFCLVVHLASVVWLGGNVDLVRLGGLVCRIVVGFASVVHVAIVFRRCGFIHVAHIVRFGGRVHFVPIAHAVQFVGLSLVGDRP